MPLAMGAVLFGAILLVAGWQNRSLLDVALGRASTVKGGSPNPEATAATTGGNPPSVGGTKSIDGHHVASWIVPIVIYARAHGWHGVVTSGYRDPREIVHPSPGLPVAPQGKSNHNKKTWPGGAVDVSDPDGFERAIQHYPGLFSVKRDPSIGDPIHFSSTGR